THRDGRVLVPVIQVPRALGDGWEPLEAVLDVNPKLAPREHVAWLLEDEVPPSLIRQLPSGWQVLGDVGLLRLPEALLDHGATIGKAYGDALGLRSVLHIHGAEGELREPDTVHLWGERDTCTVHREHGLVYHLDPAQVLFSQGNHHERHRLAATLQPGERVVDLFAGVGYFALPFARAGAEVIACEKNPASVAFLQENVAANELQGRVEVRAGDCRETAPEGWAHRVHMGYFPGTQAFLSTAVAAIAPEGGILHYHDTAGGEDPVKETWHAVLEHPALAEGDAKLLEGRTVKSYAPGVVHVVLDVEVTP
ncbi:MAG: methyltransferase, partial [Candidatus Thermoplasmatota archaeon]|nr:methyltransferase [Candidatus Thermoplasmatota archaeon]